MEVCLRVCNSLFLEFPDMHLAVLDVHASRGLSCDDGARIPALYNANGVILVLARVCGFV